MCVCIIAVHLLATHCIVTLSCHVIFSHSNLIVTATIHGCKLLLAGYSLGPSSPHHNAIPAYTRQMAFQVCNTKSDSNQSHSHSDSATQSLIPIFMPPAGAVLYTNSNILILSLLIIS